MAWLVAISSTILGAIAVLLFPRNIYQGTANLLTFQYNLGASDWDVLHHLGGISPWIPKTIGVLQNVTDPPTGCAIDQVHMMSRHAERYPTMLSGIRMLELYQRLQTANVTLLGDLAFVNEWNFFAPHPNQQFEQLTLTGPYAGSLQAMSAGVKLRSRYERLVERALVQNQTSFWTSQSDRCIDTAKYFASGFWGIDWNEKARLHIIPETQDRGGDTLTPGRACPNYINNRDDYGKEYGDKQLLKFRSTYAPSIIERLKKQNPHVSFTENEVYSMQELCGFEMLAAGKSRWCNVFTREEWESFEYARDLLHYYRAGPGNPYTAAGGMLWVKATANLLVQGPEAGPLFMSFSHDGDIITLLSALHLFPQPAHLPTNHLQRDRTYRLSDITPMGGRISFERFTCPAPKNCWSNDLYPNHVYCDDASSDVYVRLNINDGVVPIPNCDDGPGRACSLTTFLQWIAKRDAELPDWHQMCETPDDAPRSIQFLHQ